MDEQERDPAPSGERPPRRWPAAVSTWRVAAIGAFCIAGGLFVTTSLNAHGLDLRESSVTDLDHVVGEEKAHESDLQRELAELNAEVKRLSGQVDDQEVRKLRREVAALHQPAGFTAEHGPGLVVTLDDVPREQVKEILADNPDIPADALVIHQQDIQAVVNALWAGGAEAMSIKNQRIISTTGIRCVGNTVILHGVPYSPPYTIRAIGDPLALRASLAANDNVAIIARAATNLGLGYDVEEDPDLRVPAFTGSVTLKYAEAFTPPAQR